MQGDDAHDQGPARVSDELEHWFRTGDDDTIGGLVEVFGEKSFALLFVVLMATSALPLPTGGATHVFEVVVVLLALQLIAGRDNLWVPARWRRIELGKRARLVRALLRLIRWFERFSRRRFAAAFGHRLSNVTFGVLVTVGSVAAFVAPPFSGLDTLPSLGVVVISLGVLMEDLVAVIAGIVVGATGIVLEIVLGSAAIRGIGELL